MKCDRSNNFKVTNLINLNVDSMSKEEAMARFYKEGTLRRKAADRPLLERGNAVQTNVAKYDRGGKKVIKMEKICKGCKRW